LSNTFKGGNGVMPTVPPTAAGGGLRGRFPTAGHKAATDSANELIRTFTLRMNQLRQAGITQEISEIVGGVNALTDSGPVD
jgi:hypothetical protein